MSAIAADPGQTKFVLDESRIPRSWYNIAADLPVAPSPYLHPATFQPIGPDDLAPLFPMALIGQEVAQDREIEIPEPVRDAYRLYRPSPLYRAHRLERALDTPALASIPAAALTAFARNEDRQLALQAGFQLHLAKPIDAQTLVSAVATLGGKQGVGV